MDLETTKQAIASTQLSLGLNPNTVPETEFLAELFVIRNLIEDECLHIDYAGENFFQCIGENTVSVPCVDVIISSDNTIDGPGKEILCFTYYNGDNIPAGPHHALVITDLVNQTLIYWRERGQNPASGWVYNIFAKAQVNFAFNSNGDDSRFMTQEIFCELIEDTPDKITDFLGISRCADFLAEVAYLNYWNFYNDNRISEQGITLKCDFDHDQKVAAITVGCGWFDDIPPLIFAYTSVEPGHYDLVIIDEDCLVYERSADQNVIAEWNQNSMANDPLITDEFGNTLFIGEPI